MLRLRSLLLVLLLAVCQTSVVSAQDKEKPTDYLKHNKYFWICTFKRQCSNCYDCGAQRLIVKIKNRVDKRILDVKYVYYSEAYNQVMTKSAKLEGKQIEALNTGTFYVCVPTDRHWAISEISYDDGTKQKFYLNERLESWFQEPDECECSPTNYMIPPRS